MINRNKSDLIGNIYVACVLQYLILYHGCPNTYAKSPLPLITGLDEQFQGCMTHPSFPAREPVQAFMS